MNLSVIPRQESEVVLKQIPQSMGALTKSFAGLNSLGFLWKINAIPMYFSLEGRTTKGSRVSARRR
jgi:hypothetical protein